MKKRKISPFGLYPGGKISKFRNHHKIIFALVGVVGIILVWRGIWTLVDTTPFFNTPIISIIAGLFLVAISGLFFKLL